jgi:hypothetical protein
VNCTDISLGSEILSDETLVCLKESEIEIGDYDHERGTLSDAFLSC